MDSFSMLHNPYCSFVAGLNKMCFYVLLCFFLGRGNTKRIALSPRAFFSVTRLVTVFRCFTLHAAHRYNKRPGFIISQPWPNCQGLCLFFAHSLLGSLEDCQSIGGFYL